MRKSALHLCFAALLLSLSGCDNDTNSTSEAKSMEQLHQERGVPVKTEVAETRPFESGFSYNSVLTGVEETHASAMVSDKVETINYKVGDYVKKDAVVITFPTDNPAAQYYQSKVAFEHVKTTLQRIKNLYENGGISLQEFDNTKTQFEVARANWETVRQTVTVEAPISGVLTNLAVCLSDNVKQGDVLFTISKTDKLKTRVWASERQIDGITVGSRAAARWQGQTLEGNVVQVDMSLDDDNQAFGVVVEFDNPGSKVMSGVNAEVVIYLESSGNSIITGRKNIFKDGESYYVFVAENNMAVRREVHVGRSIGIEVEITDGLNPGDVLITEGQMLLDDTTKINIIH